MKTALQKKRKGEQKNPYSLKGALGNWGKRKAVAMRKFRRKKEANTIPERDLLVLHTHQKKRNVIVRHYKDSGRRKLPQNKAPVAFPIEGRQQKSEGDDRGN